MAIRYRTCDEKFAPTSGKWCAGTDLRALVCASTDGSDVEELLPCVSLGSGESAGAISEKRSP